MLTRGEKRGNNSEAIKFLSLPCHRVEISNISRTSLRLLSSGRIDPHRPRDQGSHSRCGNGIYETIVAGSCVNRRPTLEFDFITSFVTTTPKSADYLSLPKWETTLRTNESILEHPWKKTLNLWGDFQQLPGVEAIESTGFMERAMGIEPTSEAWEDAGAN